MTEQIVQAFDPLIARVRTDVTWIKREGRQSRTDEALTPARLLKHLNGGPARGVAPMRPGQSVTAVAVLDLDSHGGETTWDGMRAAAQRVLAQLRELGMEAVAFRSSGGRGIHLLMLWEDAQDAYSVRRCLFDALSRAGYAPGPAGVAANEIEVFPKQDVIEDGRFGNQFILPCAGKGAPLDPFDLEDLPREWLVGMTWPMSRAVPHVERPVREIAVEAPTAQLQVIRAALAAIPADADCLVRYEPWLRVVHAIHAGSSGSVDGLSLAHEWCQRSPLYDPDELDAKWNYARIRPGGVTVGSLFKVARELGGWQEPPDPDAFDAIVPTAAGEPEPRPLPAFKRDKAGNILASVENVTAALRRPDLCGVRLGYDTFRDELMVAPADTEEWRPFNDADYVRLRMTLERAKFKPVGRDLARDVVGLVGAEHTFDSAQIWLNSLQWDSMPRVESFFTRYFGADDSPYARAVSLYTWTAMAGRVLDPGCQTDMVPVLVGGQGIGKTRGVAAMVPAPEHVVGVNLDVRDADAARMLRGVLVGEIGELRGLHTRDSESIKDFISRTHERWVPKFKEFSQFFPRRVVFIGTTNQDEFLADETGNRRWLPLRVQGCDPALVAADREQLWAEAAARWLAGGVEFEAAQRLAPAVHGEHMLSDAWEEVVERWLADCDMDQDAPRSERPFRLDAVLRGALGFDARSYKRNDETRVGKVLRALGYSKTELRVGGEKRKWWVKGGQK